VKFILGLKFSFKRKKGIKNENNLKLKGKTKVDINKSDSKEIIKETFEDKNKKEVEKEKFEQQINSSEENFTVQTEINKESSKDLEPKREEQSDLILEELCHNCREKLDNEWKKPNWKWNMDKDIKFCVKCYNIKETEYEKLLNYCALCDSRLKFFRYNPKPQWKIKGQLCRNCWDSKNNEFKSTNLKTN
jgi:hypothetical protein